ncbi:alpha-galactosidase [Bacteroides sp.]|uniref:alpha-galactosidase D n=1 Tax=Bacteroides sp. TaxID=29523 RepID=UPI00260F05CE|nr:alpha-galactosidase [Bacteroides sp.]MDD3039354.1 alpha-galactosidase [Bacteroides sp.]
MKNKFYLLATAVISLFCSSCTESGMTQSNSDKPFAPPIMGWSSWNAFLVNISEDIIKNQADLMAKTGLKDAGYLNINIDDGFFGVRDSTGKMHVNAERFPNGMKPVVDHIHGLGLKAGIYTDAGNNTCGSMANNDHSGVGAGIHGHEEQDAQLYFGEWGFDFIKIDYCGGSYLGLDEQKRYTSIRENINKVNKNVSVNICRWAFPGTWAEDVATSWRISGDINSHWNSLKYVVGKNLYLSAYARNGHYNDMDMMVVGFRNNSGVAGAGLTPTEEEAHFGLWCIMSSPLLIGCDLAALPDSTLQLLTNKELIALNQDPLGLQAYVVQHENEGYVLVKDIEKKRGNVRAVALYNPSDTVCTFSVPFSTLEFSGNVKVRDLAKHNDLGSFSGTFEQSLPAHSAMFLRMEGENRLEPTLYEAEWAYLPLYNDLGKNSKGIVYSYDGQASGKMKVGFIGGQPENYAEWSEVYSEKGGRYNMMINYSFGKDRQLDVTVNGKTTRINSLSDNNDHNQITVPVELKPGYNVIRMGNSYNWAPDVDYFTLTKE